MLGNTNLLEYLILDTGPLIKNMKFDKVATNVLVTSGVLNEVKDAQTRQRLDLVPIAVDVREPSDISLKFVTDFAKLTGDIRSLSVTDLAVVALTYELESKLIGCEHLRTSPVNCIKVNEGFGDDKITNLAGFYVPKSTTTSSSRTTSMSSNIAPSEILNSETESGDPNVASSATSDTAHCSAQEADTSLETDTPQEVDTSLETDTAQEVDTSLETDTAHELTQSLDSCQLEEGWSTVPVKNNKTQLCDDDDMIIPDDVLISENNLDIDCDDDYEISDNDDDWITPSNICEQQTKQLTTVRVACATTDFAMQNVLLQIGLNVISVDGVLIKYAKTYVLKCTACFTVVKDCTKVFCSKCGNKTLEKVAVTVDDEGVTWYQRLSRKPKTGRGVRFSLPQPKGGRGANMPWLTEDQPDKQFHSKLRCDVKSSVDVLSNDFVKSGSPFGVMNVDSRAFRYHQLSGKHGNPNERSKRTGNRKKKKL